MFDAFLSNASHCSTAVLKHELIASLDCLLIAMEGQMSSAMKQAKTVMKKANTVMKRAKNVKTVMKAKAKARAMKVARPNAKPRGRPRKVQQTNQTADLSWAREVAGGPPMPNWSAHVVNLLADGFHGFRQKTNNAREVSLSVWSDCGGVGTELTALTHLADRHMELTGQQLSIDNFCFCDKSKLCRDFAKANHQPTHMCHDIFARDFDAGTFYCVACEADHPFPSKTDIYACCFPCGPWSMKGSRMGFNDKDGGIVWQAAKTVNQLMPGMWYMENVMGMSSSKTHADETPSPQTDLQVITNTLAEQMPGYHIMCVQQLSPLTMSYPIHRLRLVIAGSRKDFGLQEVLTRNFQTLVNNPMLTSPGADWTFFLGRGQPRCDLSCVNEPLGDGADVCSCTVDPYQECVSHPCRCEHCSKKKVHKCKWRMKHMMYIGKMTSGCADQWIAETSQLMAYPVCLCLSLLVSVCLSVSAVCVGF